MKRNVLISSVVVVVACLAALQFGAAAADNNTELSAAAQQFEQMKTLVGDWEGTADMGDQPTPAKSSFRLTAGGSALVETIFPGSPMEMMTVYHLDGDALVLTHYCVLQNQPRMKAKVSDSAREIEFEFAGAGSLPSLEADHMHEAKYLFKSKDAYQSTWTMYSGGKAAHVGVFELKRVKPAER